MVRGASAPLTFFGGGYAGPMQELYGDSARGEDWAAVRLRVSGGRIVDADAPGVAQDLRGLTLLEAAAVGGETARRSTRSPTRLRLPSARRSTSAGSPSR